MNQVIDLNFNKPYHRRMTTLWKHPNGTYYIRWQDGKKNKRKSLHTDEKHIASRRYKSFLLNNLQEIHEGLKLRLSEYNQIYLDYVENRLDESTCKLYQVALDKAIQSWGDIYINTISARHLDGYLTDLKKAGLSVATINKNYRHLKASLKQAIFWDYIKPVKFPKQIKEQQQIRYLKKNEINALLKSITDNEFKDFCLVALFSGMRSGELIRLKQSDINNPPGFIRISAEQKNATESRKPIHPFLVNIFKKYKHRKGNIFRFKRVDYISELYRKFATLAKIEHTRFHDLRHTYASYLAMAGKDIKSIQELMGHKSIQSTMGYAKLSPDHLKEVNAGLSYGLLEVK